MATAGLLGANDGILSTAGVVVGVAAATANRGRRCGGDAGTFATGQVVGYLNG